MTSQNSWEHYKANFLDKECDQKELYDWFWFTKEESLSRRLGIMARAIRILYEENESLKKEHEKKNNEN